MSLHGSMIAQDGSKAVPRGAFKMVQNGFRLTQDNKCQDDPKVGQAGTKMAQGEREEGFHKQPFQETMKDRIQ